MKKFLFSLLAACCCVAASAQSSPDAPGRLGSVDLDRVISQALRQDGDPYPLYCAQTNELRKKVKKWFDKHPDLTWMNSSFHLQEEYGFINEYCLRTLFIKTEQLEDPVMMLKLGNAYYSGLPDFPDLVDHDLALKWWKRSAEKGCDPALLQLGAYHLSAGNLKTAKGYFDDAAKRGLPQAAEISSLIGDKIRQKELRLRVAQFAVLAIGAAAVSWGIKTIKSMPMPDMGYSSDALSSFMDGLSKLDDNQAEKVGDMLRGTNDNLNRQIADEYAKNAKPAKTERGCNIKIYYREKAGDGDRVLLRGTNVTVFFRGFGAGWINVWVDYDGNGRITWDGDAGKEIEKISFSAYYTSTSLIHTYPYKIEGVKVEDGRSYTLEAAVDL